MPILFRTLCLLGSEYTSNCFEPQITYICQTIWFTYYCYGSADFSITLLIQGWRKSFKAVGAYIEGFLRVQNRISEKL